VGDWRVVYTLEGNTVVIQSIGHRRGRMERACRLAVGAYHRGREGSATALKGVAPYGDDLAAEQIV